MTTVHYGPQQSWQGDDAVQQVQVFACEEAFKKYEGNYTAALFARQGDAAITPTTGLGAMYSLRAVKDAFGRWEPLLRCGSTGILIAGSTARFATSKEALLEARSLMSNEFEVPHLFLGTVT